MKNQRRTLEVLIVLGLIALIAVTVVGLVLAIAQLMVPPRAAQKPQAPHIERRDVTHKTGIQRDARK
jgi:hypothetical protein